MSFKLEALLGTVNNIVLERAGKRREQRAIPCYAHYERLVLFGVLLRIQKGFSRDNVELHVHTLLIEIGTNQCDELRQAAHTCQRGRVEFLIQERTVARYVLL